MTRFREGEAIIHTWGGRERRLVVEGYTRRHKVIIRRENGNTFTTWWSREDLANGSIKNYRLEDE